MNMMNTNISETASDCSSEMADFNESHMNTITAYVDFLHAY